MFWSRQHSSGPTLDVTEVLLVGEASRLGSDSSVFFFFLFMLNLLSVLSELHWQLSFYVYVTILAPLSYSDKLRIVGRWLCHGLFNFMLVTSGHVCLSFCYFGMERWLNLAGLFCEQPVLPTGTGAIKVRTKANLNSLFFPLFCSCLAVADPA